MLDTSFSVATSKTRSPRRGTGGGGRELDDDADERGPEEASRRCRRLELGVVTAKGTGAQKVGEMDTEGTRALAVHESAPGPRERGSGTAGVGW